MSRNRNGTSAVSLTMAWCPLTRGSHRLSIFCCNTLHAAFMFCRERGASTGTARFTRAVKSPFFPADHKERLDDQPSRLWGANLALLRCCHPSFAPGSPAAPFPAPLPRSPPEPICPAPGAQHVSTPHRQIPPNKTRANAVCSHHRLSLGSSECVLRAAEAPAWLLHAPPSLARGQCSSQRPPRA